MGKIKLLSEEIVNQIAAGELVERPSSALKEIIENSIDALAKNIDIFIENGGKTKIIVEDDGEGLSKDDLVMCIQRYATSKLSGSNLFEINSYGFRGEAIPSIASVSRFSIESNNFGIAINFSEISDVFPSTISKGTRVSVENLFDTTPVRLKFLKSDNVELSNCLSVVENFALTKPDINFSIRCEDKTLISFKNDTIESRISKIFGSELFKKSVYFEESDGIISVRGYLFHPMDSKYSQGFQKVFVNNRIIKDKTVSAAIRNANRDLIQPGRYAAALIYIDIDPFYVDVNVSPTKSEVRFRDAAYVQKMLTDVFKETVKKFDRVALDFDISLSSMNFSNTFQKIAKVEDKKDFAVPHLFHGNFNKKITLQEKQDELTKDFEKAKEECVENTHQILEEKKNFFGEALCQIFDSYIVSRTKDDIIIIDQHAVHEKITQESMIKKLNCENKQWLLKPEIITLSDIQIVAVKKIEKHLKTCGFSVETVQSSVIISAIPSVLTADQAVILVKDILENPGNIEKIQVLDVIKSKIADLSCHNSIRSGRRLSDPEMNSIIEQMEDTESIHQCNHHRPSFVVISKKSLEKMFGR